MSEEGINIADNEQIHELAELLLEKISSGNDWVWKKNTVIEVSCGSASTFPCVQGASEKHNLAIEFVFSGSRGWPKTSLKFVYKEKRFFCRYVSFNLHGCGNYLECPLRILYEKLVNIKRKKESEEERKRKFAEETEREQEERKERAQPVRTTVDELIESLRGGGK